MTSPDPAASQPSLAERLRAALPPEQQHRADELAAFIAALPPERADATLRAAFPDLAPLLTPLIRVGDNAQIGEIHTGDIVGGNKYNITLAPDEMSAEAQRRRSQILDIVGVRVQQGITDALTAAAQLELGLTARPDAVPLAPGLRLQQRAGAQALPAGTTVSQMFDEAGGRLLILGAPGGGKSTLLLQLTAVLLDRARRDPAQPIPALLNLSSWAAEGKSLAAWLVTALGETYRIPKKIAEELVQRGRLALLLDGLDEVDPARRDAFVQAINAFQRDHLTLLAVCSRTEEYGRLAGQLELEQAIELRPLTDDQVNLALSAGGDRLAGLRAAWEHDADLRDLLRTPLLLNIATLAYADAAPTDTDAPWSRRLFPAFVERALRRRGDAQRYDHAKTLRWLRWLAQTLEAQQLSELYLERMQPGWLAPAEQRTYFWIARFFGAVVFLLVIIGMLRDYFLAPIFPALIVIVTVSAGVAVWRSIQTETSFSYTEQARWSVAQARIGIKTSFAHSLFLALPVAIFMAYAPDRELSRYLSFLIIFVILFTLLLWVTEFFNNGWVETLGSINAYVIPNQGFLLSIAHTGRRAIETALISSASVALGTVVFVIIFDRTADRTALTEVLGYGGLLGFAIGLIKALWDVLIRGRGDVIQRIIFNFVLLSYGHRPLEYILFLDYSVALLLLRRVGGGYAFQHRLLRDYLGALSDADITDLAVRARR